VIDRSVKARATAGSVAISASWNRLCWKLPIARPNAVPELDAREKQVLADIEDLRRRLRHQLHEPRRWYGSLQRLSIARAIQGSNSIEGLRREPRGRGGRGRGRGAAGY
jgi:hypothetical protein